MIKFSKHVKKLLPYDREEYLDYLGPGFYTNSKWYGVSIQKYDIRSKENIRLNDFASSYKTLIEKIVPEFDRDSSWIVNHDTKDLVWFPSEKHNLPLLRTLFKQNNVPGTFKGAIVLSTEDLLNFSKELISYPFAIFNNESFNSESAFYKNLDISHSKSPFIIKIDTHFSVDLLSTQKELISSIVTKKLLDELTVKVYKGTTDL